MTNVRFVRNEGEKAFYGMVSGSGKNVKKISVKIFDHLSKNYLNDFLVRKIHAHAKKTKENFYHSCNVHRDVDPIDFDV